MAPTASCPTPRWHAWHGNAKRTTSRPPPQVSSNGSPAGPPPTEFQVYSHSQEPPSSVPPTGYARTDGRPTSPAGCPRARPGAFDCLHVGSRSSTGAEADAGRAFVPAHPEDVPRLGWQDHWHVARDRQRRVGPYVG